MAMKFRAHETFFIRKGWLSKGMKAISKDPTVFVSKENNPMDALGLGSNMVKSLRYWLQAVGISKESISGIRKQSFTELGKKIYEHDRYIEEYGTLLLLHYKLVTQKYLSPSWFYFFNAFRMTEFNKDDFISGLNNFAIESFGESVALRSLTDDFNCIIGTYLPRYKLDHAKISPENNIDCPFGELGLIDVVDKQKKLYRKNSPIAENIDPWITLAVIQEQSRDASEISLNDLLSQPMNIGNVYNLDAITMIDALRNAERTGVVKIIRTAGLDVVRLERKMTFDECVDNYYKTLELN